MVLFILFYFILFYFYLAGLQFFCWISENCFLSNIYRVFAWIYFILLWWNCNLLILCPTDYWVCSFCTCFEIISFVAFTIIISSGKYFFQLFSFLWFAIRHRPSFQFLSVFRILLRISKILFDGYEISWAVRPYECSIKKNLWWLARVTSLKTKSIIGISQ